jgi:hypothetical protein
MKLPCGCAPLKDHEKTSACLLQARYPGREQHPAIVKLYTELNAMWYVIHQMSDEPVLSTKTKQ